MNTIPQSRSSGKATEKQILERAAKTFPRLVISVK